MKEKPVLFNRWFGTCFIFETEAERKADRNYNKKGFICQTRVVADDIDRIDVTFDCLPN